MAAWFYTAVLLITAIMLVALLFWSGSIFLAIPLIAFAALAVIGTHDLLQTRHAVLRNYPLNCVRRAAGIRPIGPPKQCKAVCSP
jgi:hypothetical protein